MILSSTRNRLLKGRVTQTGDYSMPNISDIWDDDEDMERFSSRRNLPIDTSHEMTHRIAKEVSMDAENRKPKYSGFDPLSKHDGDPISVYALKMAYRKHAKHDESIGWDELLDILGNALAQIMGDDEFVEWNETTKE